jgi:hypothetical protein
LAAELCVKKNLSRCKAFKYWRDYFFLGNISSAFKRPSVCVSAFTSYDIQHNIQHTGYSRLHEYFRHVGYNIQKVLDKPLIYELYHKPTLVHRDVSIWL